MVPAGRLLTLRISQRIAGYRSQGDFMMALSHHTSAPFCSPPRHSQRLRSTLGISTAATRMRTSAKTNITVAAALLMALAAPELSFAPAMAFLNTSHQSGSAKVPAAVFGSAITLTQRRAPRATTPPSDRMLTDPSGNVIGLRRDWTSSEDGAAVASFAKQSTGS
jgi:hypothetical protein